MSQQSRDALRALIFSAEKAKPKTVALNFFGADIELRQPSVGDIQKYMESESQTMSMVSVLIDYAYVPGTDEKVFDPADADTLKALPFNEDVRKATEAINTFTNVVLGDAEKN